MSGEIKTILTISEFTEQIRTLVEQNFRFVHLIGEISNFKSHSTSGHYYFTLKDESSQVQAVMWSSRNQELLFTPADGMKVLVKGRITLFPARGSYQIECWDIMPRGIGEMQLQFEALKQKLFSEGLFDEEFKKAIPRFPFNVVIITSKTGAVLQDFINISRRRFPVMSLFIYPVNVQGEKAAPTIIDALAQIEESKFKFDIIVIARGGGSLEDLFPFNDERLARRIFACKIPVVSAVGHEVDFTICDFVSDLRAPTPSAAAELITPDIQDLIEWLDKFSYFSRTFVQNKISFLKSSVKEIQNSYHFVKPKDLIYNYYQRLDEYSKSISTQTKNKVGSLKQRIEYIKKTLHHIAPQNNLKKGYAMIFKEENSGELFGKEKLVSRAKELNKDEDIRIKFFDKTIPAKVK